MAAISISKQLRSLDKEVGSFEKSCKKAIRILSPPAELNAAETTYESVQQIFNSLSSTIRNFQEQIAKSSAEPESDPEFLYTTELQHRLEKVQMAFTDRFLSDYPNAQIDYGKPCVAPKEKWTPSDLAKWDALEPYRAKYPRFRAIRGDGNCFFSGFTAGLLEHLVKSEERVAAFIEFLLQNEEWESPGKEAFMDLLEKLLCDPKRSRPHRLQHYLEDNRILLCCVNHFRHIAADYMQKHKSTFSPSIKAVEGKSFNAFINENVLPMGENADHYTILALCQALQFPIRIHDTNVDFNAQGTVLGGDEFEAPLATLCRNGEHYFLLYADDLVNASAPPAAIPASSRPASQTTQSAFSPTNRSIAPTTTTSAPPTAISAVSRPATSVPISISRPFDPATPLATVSTVSRSAAPAPVLSTVAPASINRPVALITSPAAVSTVSRSAAPAPVSSTVAPASINRPVALTTSPAAVSTVSRSAAPAPVSSTVAPISINRPVALTTSPAAVSTVSPPEVPPRKHAPSAKTNPIKLRS